MSKVLFDSQSWLNADTKESVRDFLECTGQEEKDFASHEALLEAVQNWLYDNVEWEWRDFLEQCGDEESHHCLVTGYFMSWRGPLQGGEIFKDLASAVRGMIMDGDSHSVFSINDEGNLVLDETHHDAPCSGNHYEFLILTDAGEKYLNLHSDMGRRELHEALKLRKRTRKVNTQIFGF